MFPTFTFFLMILIMIITLNIFNCTFIPETDPTLKALMAINKRSGCFTPQECGGNRKNKAQFGENVHIVNTYCSKYFPNTGSCGTFTVCSSNGCGGGSGMEMPCNVMACGGFCCINRVH